MDEKLSRGLSRGSLESGTLKAVGVWFYSRSTQRYLYLLRNDPKHPGTWALPGGKLWPTETLLSGMHRECMEELGQFPDYQTLVPLETFTSSDGSFEYHTWVCVLESEFVPVLNHEHLGWAWVNRGHFPRPLHPGLWNTVNVDTVQAKLTQVEHTIGALD